MRLVGDETCPLPEDPILREVASALNACGAWGVVIADLSTATDKARRDAPAIAVCEV